MNNETLTPSKYKRYDESFKRLAVELWLQGGETLEVSFDEKNGEFENVRLTGPAEFVFEGRIEI